MPRLPPDPFDTPTPGRSTAGAGSGSLLEAPARLRLARELASLAERARELSADPRTQTGALIANLDGAVALWAANRPVADALLAGRPERLEAPEKYFWIEHSERAALQLAARRGLPTEGMAMACTLFPCVDCARAIVGSGIAALMAPPPDFEHPRWGAEFRRAVETLGAGGVELIWAEPSASTGSP